MVLAVFAGLAAAAIVLVLDGLWAGRAMFRGVAEARSALTEGAVAVVTGDPGAARPLFELAAEAADSTVGATAHPSIELAERIPWLGDNIKAVEAVARASERSANAGLTMVEAAVVMDWQDVRLPATQALGSVDLPKLRAATPLLEAVAKGLGVAEAQLSVADTGRLVGPIATGYQDALATLRRRYRSQARPVTSPDCCRGSWAREARARTCWRCSRSGSPKGPEAGSTWSARGGRAGTAQPGWARWSPPDRPTAKRTSTRTDRHRRESCLSIAAASAWVSWTAWS